MKVKTGFLNSYALDRSLFITSYPSSINGFNPSLVFSFITIRMLLVPKLPSPVIYFWNSNKHWRLSSPDSNHIHCVTELYNPSSHPLCSLIYVCFLDAATQWTQFLTDPSLVIAKDFFWVSAFWVCAAQRHSELWQLSGITPSCAHVCCSKSFHRDELSPNL